MTSKFSTVKLDGGLVADARREAEIFHRSLGCQIEHWARIGKAVENAEGVSVSRVRDRGMSLPDTSAEQASL